MNLAFYNIALIWPTLIRMGHKNKLAYQAKGNSIEICNKCKYLLIPAVEKYNV